MSRKPVEPLITRNQLVAVAAIIIVVGGLYLIKMQDKPHAEVLKVVPDTHKKQAVTLKRLIVHVAGAVNKPGVYEVGESSRVIDAIKVAGSERADADLDQLNMAAPVVDGQKIFVPIKGVASVSPAQEEGKIGINSADADKLQDLPGIGEVMADRIVKAREKCGRFKSIDDLKDIDGIGPKKFEQIKDCLVLD